MPLSEEIKLKLAKINGMTRKAQRKWKPAISTEPWRLRLRKGSLSRGHEDCNGISSLVSHQTTTTTALLNQSGLPQKLQTFNEREVDKNALFGT